MFLQTLQNLLQALYPNAEIRTKNNSLYLKDANNFIGEVKITDAGSYAFFDEIYVKVSNQRGGIGSQVLTAIEDACRQSSLKRIECRPIVGVGYYGVDFFSKHGFDPKPHDPSVWTKNV